ncbi:MAG: cytochrome c nitrite reductase small subunit [Geobacteraceae bacterium]|nr:cytochrome c nitrite reductase small subunit [Geobacteraceae bacterium]
MRLLKSKKCWITILAMVFAGLSLLAFLLVGPPQLLALSESPTFCASCHVMEEQHTAWSHAGAHRRIRCVDCHLPNGNPLVHYVWKSIDGMKDVVVFNSGMVPDRITLSEHGAKVVQGNCIRCHAEAVSQMDTTRQCWGCHRQLRHRMSGIVAVR